MVEDKTISILSYIPVLGWIIALIMNSDKTGEEKKFNAFHLRQGLGLSIICFVYSLLNWIILWIPFLGKLANIVIVLFFIGIAVIGIISANKGEKNYMPFFGKPTDNLLGEAFE